jgi:hypothetical protein
VEGVDVGLQATGLREALVAQLAAYLVADAVGAKVIAQRVAVSILPIAHVALGRLVRVGLFMDGVRRLVGEPFGAEITGEAALWTAGAVRQRRRRLLGVAVQIGEVRVAAHVQPQVAAQVLHVGEAAQAGEADQLLLAPALQLLGGQGQPGPRQQTAHRPPLLKQGKLIFNLNFFKRYCKPYCMRPMF